ncbi:hypothetical protein RCL1_000730 [Eukaryota sp. TZLM3-RCL]
MGLATCVAKIAKHVTSKQIDDFQFPMTFLKPDSFDSASKSLFQLSVFYRVLVIFCLILSANFLSSYDSSSILLSVNSISQHPHNCYSKHKIAHAICSFFIKSSSSLCNWDGQHLSVIAQNGYTTDQSFAFFPGFPFLTKFISFFFNSILRFSSPYLSTCLIGALVSNILLIMSCHYFFVLSTLVLGHWKISFKATLLFIVAHPGNVFFSVNYSESLFLFLTLFGLCHLFTVRLTNHSSESVRLVQSKMIVSMSSVIAFFFASFVKSIGIFNVIFIIFTGFKDGYFKRFGKFIRLCLYCLLVTLPYFAFQFYSCSKVREIAPELCPKWHNFLQVYSKIQSKYWNIGAFNYWNLKQSPNFILASPLIFLTITTVVTSCLIQLTLLNSLLFRSKIKKITSRTGRKFAIKTGDDVTVDSIQSSTFDNFGLNSGFIFGFLLHLLILFFIVLIFGHVQTISRILTVNPLNYWVLSWLIFANNQTKSKVYWGLFLFSCFSFLSIFGTVFFATFNPFT